MTTPRSALRPSRAAKVVLASLAVVALACAPGPRPKSTAEALVPDLEIRAMLLLLVDRQIFDPGVVQLAASGGPATREELAVALGRIPRAEGRPVLEGLLEDAAPAVRRAAVFALGELEEDGALPALARAMGDPDREVGRLAVEAAAKLGADLTAVERSLAGLPADEQAARLLPSLFRFKQVERVTAAVAALGESDRERRFWAAYALGRDPLPEAAGPLRTLLADADPLVRAWAARGLGQVGGGDDLARLLPLLDDAQISPVVQALRAGARLVAEGKAQPAPEWRPALARRIVDSRAGVRAAAIEASAGWLADADLASLLEERAERGEGADRGLALMAVAEGRTPRAGVLAGLAAETASSPLRALAARAAGRLGDGALLARLAADPSAPVRAASAEARLAAGGDPALVEAILSDPDEGVRLTALDWLAEHPILDFSKLGPAAARALVDPSEEPGLAALRALAARGKAISAERSGILELAERAAASGRYVLRREAGAVFTALEAPRPDLAPADDGRPIERYREIVETTWHPRTLDLVTHRGTIRIELACRQAPLTCLSFLQLAGQGFFDGLTFHRVVPDFVVQGGDPRGDGIGGPGYSIRDEIGRIRYERGVVGMALAGPDTGGSQFFITLSPQPHLDGGFTAFGRVVSGDEVLDRIEVGDRIERIVEVAPPPRR